MNVGGVAEWSIAAVLKTAVSGHRDRGFESHPLRSSLGCVNLKTGSLEHPLQTRLEQVLQPTHESTGYSQCSRVTNDETSIVTV